MSSLIVQNPWIALSEFALKSKILTSNTNKKNRNIVIRTGYVNNSPEAVFMEAETLDVTKGKPIYFVNISTIADRGVGEGFSSNTEVRYKNEKYLETLSSTAIRLKKLSGDNLEIGKIVACLASKNDRNPLWVKKKLLSKKKSKDLSCKF